MKSLWTTINKQEERIQLVKEAYSKGIIWRRTAEENIKNAENIISKAMLKLSELKQAQ
jgi:hypothetical protein